MIINNDNANVHSILSTNFTVSDKGLGVVTSATTILCPSVSPSSKKPIRNQRNNNTVILDSPVNVFLRLSFVARSIASSVYIAAYSVTVDSYTTHTTYRHV